MTVAFQSFGRSPFGAFVKSPLGARDDIGGAARFVYFDAASNYYVADNLAALTWTLYVSASGLDLRGVRSGRIFRTRRYTDDLFASTIEYAGSELNIGPVIKFEGSDRLWTEYAQSAGDRRVAYSDDNGASWVEVFGNNVGDPPIPGGFTFNALFTYDSERVIRMASGRILFKTQILLGATQYVSCCYSDDNGASWTSSTSALLASTTATVIFIRDGKVYLMADGSGAGTVWESLDEGATFSVLHTSVPAGVCPATDQPIVIEVGSRLAVFSNGGSGLASYSDNVFDTVTGMTIGTGGQSGICAKEGVIYAMEFSAPFNKIWSSSDGGANFSLYATADFTANGNNLVADDIIFQ